MVIIATGIGLAKDVFAVHDLNGSGTVQLRQPKAARSKLKALVARHCRRAAPCGVGRELRMKRTRLASGSA